MANDVSSSLPDLDLKDLSIIRVDTNDSNANVKQITIHLTQDVPDDALSRAGPFMLVPGPPGAGA